MPPEELIQNLKSLSTAERFYRERSRDFILNRPELFPALLRLALDPKHEFHVRAAWVAELVSLEYLDILEPELDFYAVNLYKVRHESALRPLAKIGYLANRRHFDSRPRPFEISAKAAELIISNNFDWLLAEHKVATHVFAMKSLYLWSAEKSWIREELRLLLEKNSAASSRAYQAASRKILEKI